MGPWRGPLEEEDRPASQPQPRGPGTTGHTVAPQLERLSARAIDDSLVHGTQKEIEVHLSDVHTMGWCKPRT